MATPLKPEDVPKELECPICLSIPLDPRILKSCSHVFCKDCIHSSLSQRHFCPVCRCRCILEQVVLLKDESSITHRIWSNIPIKCEHHGNGCTWTGAISDYKAHEESCPATEMIRKLRSLERENKRLENETKKSKSVERKLRAEIQEMREKLEKNKQDERKCRDEQAVLLLSLTIENKKLKTEKDDLENSIQMLKQQQKDYPRLERENRKIKREKNGLVNDINSMLDSVKRSLLVHIDGQTVESE